MIFLVVSVVVPVFIWLFFPGILQALTKKSIKRDWILLLACVLYLVSWYLPSPLIHGENTAFTTHFIGGGVFTGLLWIFTKRQLHLKLSWLVELTILYAAVSALGVMNELFELAVAEFHLFDMSGADTWWDLLANTSGAALTWIVYRAVSTLRATKEQT